MMRCGRPYSWFQHGNWASRSAASASRCPVRKERRVFLQGGAHIGMVGSERLLLDGERPLVERLGAGQVPDRRVAAGGGVGGLVPPPGLPPPRPLPAGGVAAPP